MRFKIIHDTKGRIRLRSGGGYFLRTQECSLEEMLEALSYVYAAKVSSVNGGMLILYEPAHRQELLEYIRSIHIAAVDKRENSGNELANLFKRDLSRLMIRRFVMKSLLPAPIGIVATYIKAIPYIKNALASICKFKADVALLDGAAVGAALFRGMYKEVNSIIFLLKVSGLLESYTRKRTKTALAESLAFKSDTVWKAVGDTHIKTPLSQIQKGDVVIFRDGTMIAIDGTVVSGQASVNESSMTGEPLPVLKKEGAMVYAGTVIEEGSIQVQAQSEANDSRISHIVDMIENGENLKASVQSRAERMANSIVPYSLGLSALTYLFTGNITKALSVLMVDYSCAIKLATPISVISAMREASGYGFVVKGGKHLESFSNADTIVLIYRGCSLEDRSVSGGAFSSQHGKSSGKGGAA